MLDTMTNIIHCNQSFRLTIIWFDELCAKKKKTRWKVMPQRYGWLLEFRDRNIAENGERMVEKAIIECVLQDHFHFSLSCIGEGNGNPLQCSCLENPRDGGAWQAAISGVSQSRTRLKRLSSRSSSIPGSYYLLTIFNKFTLP